MAGPLGPIVQRGAQIVPFAREALRRLGTTQFTRQFSRNPLEVARRVQELQAAGQREAAVLPKSSRELTAVEEFGTRRSEQETRSRMAAAQKLREALSKSRAAGSDKPLTDADNDNEAPRQKKSGQRFIRARTIAGPTEIGDIDPEVQTERATLQSVERDIRSTGFTTGVGELVMEEFSFVTPRPEDEPRVIFNGKTGEGVVTFPTGPVMVASRQEALELIAQAYGQGRSPSPAAVQAIAEEQMARAGTVNFEKFLNSNEPFFK